MLGKGGSTSEDATRLSATLSCRLSSWHLPPSLRATAGVALFRSEKKQSLPPPLLLSCCRCCCRRRYCLLPLLPLPLPLLPLLLLPLPRP
eukprot:COSAG05_NODE_8_length_40675_cov_148.837539_20_plen_90_part_00